MKASTGRQRDLSGRTKDIQRPEQTQWRRQLHNCSASVRTACSGGRVTGRVRGEERGGHRKAELLRTLKTIGLVIHVYSRVMVVYRRCEGVTCVLSYLVVVGAWVNDDVY